MIWKIRSARTWLAIVGTMGVVCADALAKPDVAPISDGEFSQQLNAPSVTVQSQATTLQNTEQKPGGEGDQPEVAVAPKADGHIQITFNKIPLFIENSDIPAGLQNDDVLRRVVAGGIRFRDPYPQGSWKSVINRDWPPDMASTLRPMSLRETSAGTVLADPEGPNLYQTDPQALVSKRDSFVSLDLRLKNFSPKIAWSLWAVAPFRVMPGSAANPGTLMVFPVRDDERSAVAGRENAEWSGRWNYDAASGLMIVNPNAPASSPDKMMFSSTDWVLVAHKGWSSAVLMRLHDSSRHDGQFQIYAGLSDHYLEAEFTGPLVPMGRESRASVSLEFVPVAGLSGDKISRFGAGTDFARSVRVILPNLK